MINFSLRKPIIFSSLAHQIKLAIFLQSNIYGILFTRWQKPKKMILDSNVQRFGSGAETIFDFTSPFINDYHLDFRSYKGM